MRKRLTKKNIIELKELAIRENGYKFKTSEEYRAKYPEKGKNIYNNRKVAEDTPIDKQGFLLRLKDDTVLDYEFFEKLARKRWNEPNDSDITENTWQMCKMVANVTDREALIEELLGVYEDK